MSHSASHRRRRGSSHNNANNNANVNANANVNVNPQYPPPSPDSKTKKGFWFGSKKSGNASDRSGDTLLPTTFKMVSPLGGKSYRKSLMGNNNTTATATATATASTISASASSKPIIGSATSLCNGMNNSFLMGGVDKRRYRRKPKGLLYRMLWSSLPRRLVVSFVLLYLAVYHLLVPLGYWLIRQAMTIQMPASNSSVPSDSAILASLVHGPRFDALPTLKQEMKYRNQLLSEREAVEEHGYQNLPGRWKVLEQIAPEWFHRFDPDIVHIKQKKKTTITIPPTTKTKTQSVVDAKKEHNIDTNDKEAKQQPNDNDKVTVKAMDGDNKESSNEKTPKNDNTPKDKSENNSNPKPTASKPTTSKKRYYHQVVDKTKQGDVDSARHLMVTGGIYIPNDDQGDAADDENDNLMLPLRTLHNYEEMAAAYSSCGIMNATTTTTIVTQTSIDRLWIVHETCANRWRKDPIVAVVFVPHSAQNVAENAQRKNEQELDSQSEKLLQDCPNLTLVRYEADHIESLKGRYPVNRLRNVGLDLVRTSHVLVMDVDLVPSRDLGNIVGTAIRNTNNNNNDNNNDNTSHRKALVVPAFEKKAPQSCDDAIDKGSCLSKFLKQDGAFLPRTFSELQECYNTEDCVVFQSEYNWDGHSTTRSDRWMQKDWYESDGNDEQKNYKRIPCFHTARYEPYVVVEWCPITNNNNDNDNFSKPISPYYDERFYGYGKNKIELVSHLRRSNVKFEILPEGFLVHNPHPESSTKDVWLNKEDTSDLHATMDALYGKFLQELGTKYKSVHKDSTKLCEQTHTTKR